MLGSLFHLEQLLVDQGPVSEKRAPHLLVDRRVEFELEVVRVLLQLVRFLTFRELAGIEPQAKRMMNIREQDDRPRRSFLLQGKLYQRFRRKQEIGSDTVFGMGPPDEGMRVLQKFADVVAFPELLETFLSPRKSVFKR